MSIKRQAGTVCLTLLISSSLYPCSIVRIEGEKPDVVRQVSGTVVGSGRYDLMGKSHNEERHAITVANAIISLTIRTDLEFIKAGEIQYPPGVKPSGGNLKKWSCGKAVAQTTTDQTGSFAFSKLKPGKYCLEITGPKPKTADEAAMHASFLIDVAKSAPKATLVAEISPWWPDCCGGESLKLKPLN